MDRKKADPLSPEDAKLQLRLAADQLGLRAWVQQRPLAALTTSFMLGVTLGTSRPLRSAMLRMFVKML